MLHLPLLEQAIGAKGCDVKAMRVPVDRFG
jgi:hypothetical protein